MPKKKKAVKGPKGPNPLAVKKPKKKTEGEATTGRSKKETETTASNPGQEDGSEPGVKRKRKRKHKPGGGDGDAAAVSKVADEED